MPAINVRELKRRFDLEPERTVRHLAEAIEAKKLRPEDFSIRDLFEASVRDGSELLRAIDPRGKSGRRFILEANDAVDLASFANITGQIVFSKIMDAYESPQFLWKDLVEEVDTPFPYGEKVPGVGRMGDQAGVVGEGEAFPNAGLNEEYHDIPATVKRGNIVNVTKEAVIFDRTGLILKRASEVGEWLGWNKEKRVLDVVVGTTNNYKRNGTATNTYLTSGAYINDVTSNALVDWTDVQTVELLFDAITDPNTGEPIHIVPNTLLVPTALKHTAKRVVSATEIEQVDNQANASTVRTHAPNPISGYKILTSQYVKSRSSSATKWWLGEPKKAFAYYRNWDVTAEQQGSSSDLAFERDILNRYKASERGVAVAQNPRYMARSDQ